MHAKLQALLSRIPAKQQQFLLLGGVLLALFLGLYVFFAVRDSGRQANPAPAGSKPAPVVNVMPPGAQVDPRDRWVGEAGRKLSQYEAEKAAQDQAMQQIQRRFDALEKQLAQQPQPAPQPGAAAPPASPPALPPPPPAPAPPSPPPPPPPGVATGLPPGTPGAIASPPTGLARVSMRPAAAATGPTGGPASGASAPNKAEESAKGRSADNYLPVSFTRALLLSGLNAPAGGQAQSNPLPVLLKLEDHAVLPNRYRSQVRECFVIAAGYGEISSERALLRTETLSCVRKDGSALEVRIEGNVMGEDGKPGLRGRVVTKQGQILANALLAGVVGGIGQAVSARAATTSTSVFGTVSTIEGSRALQAGFGIGVGRAMDRLAQYYISLAEKTYPVIEVDGGRTVDVVLTKGVVIDSPIGGPSGHAENTSAVEDDDRYLQVTHED